MEGRAAYDPERWLRAWTTTAAGLLVASFLVPTYVPVFRDTEGSVRAGIGSRNDGWVWAWQTLPDDTWGVIRWLSPYALGIVALVALRAARGRPRALMIGLPAIVESVFGVLVLLPFLQLGFTLLTSALVLGFLLMTPAAWGTAAGVHLARRHPESRGVRRGSRLVAAILVAVVVGTFASAQAVFSDLSSINVSLWDVPFWGLSFGFPTAYGALAVFRFQGSLERVRTRLLAVATRVALLLFAGIHVSMRYGFRSAGPGFEPVPEPAVSLALFVGWLAREGSTYALGALGVAAWFEPRVAPRPLDADVLVPIFR